jgi:polysaccharide export outer membrane protein
MVSLSRLSLFALGAAAVAFLNGCATDDVKGSNPVIPAATTTAQLRPGDSLTITLQGVPDPSTNTVQIDDQGLITLPFIGPHPAAGVSTADLSTRIRAAYIAKKIYTTVDVSVSVTERYVYVGGEVAKPGRIIWTPDLTVAKAVQAAGGFSLYAKEGKVTLVRDQKAYELNARLAQQNPAQDPRLIPGDSLQVPRSAF